MLQLILSLTGVLFFMATAPLNASCGAASCSLDTQSTYAFSRGDVRMEYTWEYIDQNTPRTGRTRASVGAISGHHNEQRTLTRAQKFGLTWAPADRWVLEANVPYYSRGHRHIHNHHGTPIPEGWNFSGLGDLRIQTRYALLQSESEHHAQLGVIAGVEFPTGKTHIENANGDEAEPGITPGTGTYDWITGLSGQVLMSHRWPLYWSALYKINGRGHEDYRLGNTLSVNGGTDIPVLPALALITQLNLVVQERDDKGDTSEEVGKTGGEFLYISPGVRVFLGKSWEWRTLVQIPVYQRVNQIQLTSDYNLQSGVSYRFKL